MSFLKAEEESFDQGSLPEKNTKTRETLENVLEEKKDPSKDVKLINEFDDPKISVIGVGGAGNNAVNNMIRKGNLDGVRFLVCNTDVQTLRQALCPMEQRIQIGKKVAQGLGAGASPEMGRSAAEENLKDVLEAIGNSHMLFVTAGMGGGTGTGAAPVIAKAAREQGILTVGVVTKPFDFEGSSRKNLAEEGIRILEKCVDMLLVIPNQNLFSLATQQTSLADSFAIADDVLYQAVQTVTTLILKTGLINLDFADVRRIMRGNDDGVNGRSLMGTGEASGEDRAVRAAENAIACPLLENMPLDKGAVSALINITGGLDMTLHEVSEATNRIKEELDPSAHIIFGATFDERLEGVLRVSAIVTGLAIDEKTDFFVPDSKGLEHSFESKKNDKRPEELEQTLGNRHTKHDDFFDDDFTPSLSLHEDSDVFGTGHFGKDGQKNTADPLLHFKLPQPPVQEKSGGLFSFFKKKKSLTLDVPNPHPLKNYALEEESDEFEELMRGTNKKSATSQEHSNVHPLKETDAGIFHQDQNHNTSIPAFLRREKQKKSPK
jgi:cell division protein FtsZ